MRLINVKFTRFSLGIILALFCTVRVQGMFKSLFTWKSNLKQQAQVSASEPLPLDFFQLKIVERVASEIGLREVINYYTLPESLLKVRETNWEGNVVYFPRELFRKNSEHDAELIVRGILHTYKFRSLSPKRMSQKKVEENSLLISPPSKAIIVDTLAIILVAGTASICLNSLFSKGIDLFELNDETDRKKMVKLAIYLSLCGTGIYGCRKVRNFIRANFQ